MEVTILSLWLPILIAAVVVFVASSVIHMLLPHHKTDLAKVPDEDAVMVALREFQIPPGEYFMPHAGSMSEMGSEAHQEKVKAGPVAKITVWPKDNPMAMGPQLTQWFVYLIVVSVFVAYLTSRTVAPGAEYYEIFRVAGTTAFLAYAMGTWQHSIWWKQKWSTSVKNTFDGLVYALLTAGAFAGFWPGG